MGKDRSIESGTPDKEGVDRVGAVLKDELESAGVETAVIPMERFGNLLTGVWNKEAAGQPIVLIGHMDTVFAKGTLEKIRSASMRTEMPTDREFWI